MMDAPDIWSEGRKPRYLGTTPPRDKCVLRYVLARRAEEHPERVFIRQLDAGDISYREFRDQVERIAAGLAGLGVKQGDTVTVWLPNSVDMVRIWFAINWLGAVFVPINTAYRGHVLQHVVQNAASEVLVTCADLMPRLHDIETPSLTTIVEFGDSREVPPGIRRVPADALWSDDPCPNLDREVQPWDPQSIIFTSGTTGPSKGVVSPYAQLWESSGSDVFYMLDGEDCTLVCGPLFHIAGTLPVTAMLNRGGSFVLEDFSTGRFWDVVRRSQASFVILVGVMSDFIFKQPPQPDDADNCLRKVMMIPLPDSAQDFAKRFGVTVWTMYNMTELNVPLMSPPDPTVAGSCGRARQGNELQIVDEFDRPVAVGETGELVIRAQSPWRLNTGYFRNDEATAKAWRNGWFHTGDAFRRDEDGNYFFVDRIKDTIRRRGENISSFEVEFEIIAHPEVRECAVVAVAAQHEDDVLAVVSPVEGCEIDPAELFEFLRPRMAHFMLPRYIRVMKELPHTPTQKIEKYRLRQEGVTRETWDREAHGIRVRREKVSL